MTSTTNHGGKIQPIELARVSALSLKGYVWEQNNAQLQIAEICPGNGWFLAWPGRVPPGHSKAERLKYLTQKEHRRQPRILTSALCVMYSAPGCGPCEFFLGQLADHPRRKDVEVLYAREFHAREFPRGGAQAAHVQAAGERVLKLPTFVRQVDGVRLSGILPLKKFFAWLDQVEHEIQPSRSFTKAEIS